MNNQRKSGQALVELVFVSGMWGLMLAGLVVYCRLGLLRQRALSAARLGAVLLSSGLVEEEDVQVELQDHLALMQDPSFVQWSWQTGQFDETPASHFYKLMMTEVNAQCQFHLAGGVSLPPLSLSEKVVMQKAPSL